MISKSFKLLSGLIFIFFSTISYSEEKIDIWKKEKINPEKSIKSSNKKTNIEKANKVNPSENIKIEDGSFDKLVERRVFGVYDPSKNNFDLNMWSTTNAEDVTSSIKRLKKIKLSKTSNDILENILLSFSYPPKGMGEKEFASLKVNWLIDNNRSDLIEEFLKQNKEFEEKVKQSNIW